MKKLLAICLMLAGISAAAQEVNSTYFLDHYDFGYRINPAYLPDEDVNCIVGVLLDNIGISSYSNVGLGSFLIPTASGGFTTGFDKSVSKSTFLGGLNENNILNAGLNLNLLTVGFRTDPNGFATIEMNVHAGASLSLPKSTFGFLKDFIDDSTDGNTYSIADTDLQSTSYAEFALGYSRKFGDRLQAGVRLKFLAGIEDARFHIDNLKAVMPATSDDPADVTANGSLSLAAPVELGVDNNGYYDLSDISYKDGLPGYGFAADLGVTYVPIDGLSISAAIQDLGFMCWNNVYTGKASYDKAVEKSGVSSVTEELVYAFGFNPSNRASLLTNSLPMTLRLGARYAMPFYDKLSVGVLETFKTGYYSYNDLRIGATISPVRNVSFTANYGINTLGNSLGCALNFDFGPIDLFVAMDSLYTKFLSGTAIPLGNLNNSINLGLLLQFRSKK